MKTISKVRVYGIDESFAASKYPMSVNVDECTSELTGTIKNLGSCEKGSGHDNFLNGIIVQFDLTLSIKAWVEAERYHFLDFVSSQSTIHKIVHMDIDKSCNEYVTEAAKKNLKLCVDVYNETKSKEDYLRVLHNIPTGFELTARMTTNYRQLKTIYDQRIAHVLPEWREVCEWIYTLPKFKEICLDNAKKETRAKWITQVGGGGFNELVELRCSNCRGVLRQNEDVNKYKYCPMCGAKMDW